MEPTALDLDGGNVGGPLMTSVMNGARNGVATSRFTPQTGDSTANALTLNSSSSFNSFSLGGNDLDFGDLFPTSTWGELEPTSWTDPVKPDSCQSITPVSTPTPRPPSAPVYSPAAPTLPSPFTAQPSPTAVPNPPTPANPFASTFPFSPLAEPNFPVDEPKQESKEHVLEESGRLRNLLLKPPVSTSGDSTADSDERSKQNQILKNLLNQEDDEEKNSENRGTSPRGGLASASRSSVSRSADQPKQQANNMLLKVCSLYVMCLIEYIRFVTSSIILIVMR